MASNFGLQIQQKVNINYLLKSFQAKRCEVKETLDNIETIASEKVLADSNKIVKIMVSGKQLARDHDFYVSAVQEISKASVDRNP